MPISPRKVNNIPFFFSIMLHPKYFYSHFIDSKTRVLRIKPILKFKKISNHMPVSKVSISLHFPNIEWFSPSVLGLCEVYINGDYAHGKKVRYREEMRNSVVFFFFF